MTDKPDTVHALLMACPDDQILRMQSAWKAAASGDWAEAAFRLRNAEREGATPWHSRCGSMAARFEAKGCLPKA